MKHLSLFLCSLILIACNQKEPKRVQSNKAVDISKTKDRILFIVSNQDTYGSTRINTANHFAEIVHAYDVFIKSGFEMDFVSPKGGAVPIGYLTMSDSIEKKYLYNFEFMKHLKQTFSPDEIDPSRYGAVYYGGGGAAMFGVPENEAIQNIAMKIYNEQKGIVSAICHGTAGIVNLKATNGDYLYKGKEVNGFPDLFENTEAQYYQQFPFSIEQTITERGGTFTYSEKGWDNYFVVDDRLITGQDPTAAASVAKKVVQRIQLK